MNRQHKRVRWPAGNVLRGLLRLARGDGGGLTEFGNTQDALTASIAPLIAFPLVSAVLFGATGHWILAGVMLASRICGVLVQPLFIEFVARRWAKSSTWLVTSTTLNWSVWLLIPITLLGGLLANGLVRLGLARVDAVMWSLGGSYFYLLSVQSLIVRSGLRAKWRHAVPVVIGLNSLVLAICVVPFWVHPELMRLILHPDLK